MKNKFHLPLAILAVLTILITSCAKPPSSSDSWGDLIPIPNMVQSSGDDAHDLKTTNEGIYMEVTRADSPNDWIYRYQISAGFQDWIFHEEPDNYFDYNTDRETTEWANQFTIFFSTIDKNGYVNINTGLPALMEENHPAGFSALNEMLVDNSPQANKWAFFGDIVKIQDNTNLGIYNTICTVPNPGGILFAEADPFDAVIWAATSTEIYQITPSGTITVFDVSSYDDPSMVFHSIEKIRFSYDPAHKDVYFRYQNKVFKIADGTTLSLFYTIDNGSNFLGGDFAVDNTYMYATDGTKKHLSLLTETNIIPEQPNTTDQSVLIDYVMKKNAFNLGPIEVSKNDLDPYIYAIYNCNLLRVPKSL